MRNLGGYSRWLRIVYKVLKLNRRSLRIARSRNIYMIFIKKVIRLLAGAERGKDFTSLDQVVMKAMNVFNISAQLCRHNATNVYVFRHSGMIMLI